MKRAFVAFTVASLFLFATLVPALGEENPSDPIDLAPADAAIFVRLAPHEKLSPKVNSFLPQIDPKAELNLNEKALLRVFGQEGVAVAEKIDRTRPWALVTLNAQSNSVVIVPVTNYGEFLKVLLPTGTEVRQEEGLDVVGSRFLKERGAYALASGSKEMLLGLLQGIQAQTLRQKLSSQPEALEAFSSADFGVYLVPERLKLVEKIEEARGTMAGAMGAGGAPAGAKIVPLMQAYLGWAKDTLLQTKSVVVAANILQEGGVGATSWVEFDPAGTVAAALIAQKPASVELLGFLSGEPMIALEAHFGLGAFKESYLTFLDEIYKAMAPEETEAATEARALAERAIDLYTGDLVAGMASSAEGGMLIEEVVRVKDPAAVRALMVESVEKKQNAANLLSGMGVAKYDMSYTANVDTHAGIPIDLMEQKMEVSDTPEMAGMASIFGAGGIRSFLAFAGNDLVLASGSVERQKSLMDRVQAKSGDFTSRPEVARALQHLPNQANLILLFSIPRYMQFFVSMTMNVAKQKCLTSQKEIREAAVRFKDKEATGAYPRNIYQLRAQDYLPASSFRCPMGKITIDPDTGAVACSVHGTPENPLAGLPLPMPALPSSASAFSLVGGSNVVRLDVFLPMEEILATKAFGSMMGRPQAVPRIQTPSGEIPIPKE